MDDDLKTLQAIRAGDEAALIELMERYREPIFRLAYRYVGNPTDAASLAEATFVKVYFNAHRYRPRAAVKSWVFALARNLCRDFLRRERGPRASLSLSAPPRRPGEAVPLGDTLADRAPHSAASAETRERLQEIQHAIRSLPEKLRFPFVFCVLEGHPQETAAEILETSRKTVESRIYRARQILRAELKD